MMLLLKRWSKVGWRGPFRHPIWVMVVRLRGDLESNSFQLKLMVPESARVDDFTESLINLTNGSEECIVVHGIDFILAGIAYRMDRTRKSGLDANEFVCQDS